MLILFGYLYLILIRYIHNSQFNLLVYSLLSTYLIFRYAFPDFLFFYPSFLDNNFKYSDIITVIAILHSINLLLLEYKHSKTFR
jgi:hypothetical protein